MQHAPPNYQFLSGTDVPMQRLSQESIEAACGIFGLPLPPTQRVKIRHYTHGGKVAPCFRRKPLTNPHKKFFSITDDIPLRSGIYFFWREGVPFYVGQAVDLRQRLLGHFMKKYCDEVAWLACPKEHLTVVEDRYIAILSPIGQHGQIKRVECDRGETYVIEERVGDLVVGRTPEYRHYVEPPPPPGAIIPFPVRAS